MPKAKKKEIAVVVSAKKKEDLQFEIDQLRKEKMIYALDGILVVLISVISAIFLPEMVYRYVFGSGTSNLDPSVLTTIPTVAYFIAFLFTLFVGVVSIMKCVAVKKLEKQLKALKK